MQKPKIAVMQSMRADTNRGGPFFPQALKNKGFGGYEIFAGGFNEILSKSGRVQLVADTVELISAQEIDGLMWRARIFPNFIDSAKAIQKNLSARGVVTMEDPSNLAICASKILSNKFFDEKNLPTPNTTALYFQDFDSINFEEIFENHAGQNGAVFAKVEFGSDGKGAGKFSSPADLYQFMESEKQNIIVQDLIMTNDRTSLRVDIVAGNVINMMRFHPKGNSDMSNGGPPEHLNHMPTEVLDLAMRAYNESGLFFAGVDIMQDRDNKLFVLESQMPAVHYLGEHREKTINAVIDAFAEKVMRERATPSPARH